MFVGAPNGEEEKVKERFLKEGISTSQLIVRIANERESFMTSFSRYSAQVFRVRRHLCNDALKNELKVLVWLRLKAYLLVFMCWLVVLVREVPSG